jgi:hypothetical protein
LRSSVQASKTPKEHKFLTSLIILPCFVHFLLAIYPERPYSLTEPESAATAAEEQACS